jgi:hypothetical protein
MKEKEKKGEREEKEMFTIQDLPTKAVGTAITVDI